MERKKKSPPVRILTHKLALTWAWGQNSCYTCDLKFYKQRIGLPLVMAPDRSINKSSKKHPLKPSPERIPTENKFQETWVPPQKPKTHKETSNYKQESAETTTRTYKDRKHGNCQIVNIK